MTIRKNNTVSIYITDKIEPLSQKECEELKKILSEKVILNIFSTGSPDGVEITFVLES